MSKRCEFRPCSAQSTGLFKVGRSAMSLCDEHGDLFVNAPFCVYAARLIWQHGQWCLSWHRRRIGRSPIWICWLQFKRGIHTNVVVWGN